MRGRTGDQHDAFSIAAWLSRADRDGSLAAFLNPDLSPPERTLARVEGWILGVANLADLTSTVTIRRENPSTAAPLARLKQSGSQITKACPECGYAFRGGTWGGIDAHWKAFHKDIMRYEAAWPIIRAGEKPSSKMSR